MPKKDINNFAQIGRHGQCTDYWLLTIFLRLWLCFGGLIWLIRRLVDDSLPWRCQTIIFGGRGYIFVIFLIIIPRLRAEAPAETSSKTCGKRTFAWKHPTEEGHSETGSIHLHASTISLCYCLYVSPAHLVSTAVQCIHSTCWSLYGSWKGGIMLCCIYPNASSMVYVVGGYVT